MSGIVKAAALVAAAALAALACDKGAPEAPAEPPKAALKPVRIQLNWVPEPEFGGLYAAEMNGYFAQEGLAVELIPGSASIPSPQLVATGQVELGVVGGDQIPTLRAQGAPLVGVFATFQVSPRAIAVHASSPHASLKDLWASRARVMMEPGLPSARWLDARFGGDKLERVPSTGSLATFMADEHLAQAVFVFAEPVELTRRQVPVRLFPVADSGYNPYGQVVATREALLKEDPELVKAAVRAIRRGWESYLADPGPVNAHLAQLNPAMAKEAMDIAAQLETSYIRGAGGPLGEMSLTRWQTLVEQLVEVGAIEKEKAPEAAGCFADL